MDAQSAHRLMETLRSLGNQLNVVAERIEALDASDQKQQLKQNMARIMSYVYTDLMIPIIKEHPSLDLDV
jgi:2-oxo-4-hydroxy-4-carboxy--5-ureidoimidazoline (OHCU) decarboxylase